MRENELEEKVKVNNLIDEEEDKKTNKHCISLYFTAYFHG